MHLLQFRPINLLSFVDSVEVLLVEVIKEDVQFQVVLVPGGDVASHFLFNVTDATQLFFGVGGDVYL